MQFTNNITIILIAFFFVTYFALFESPLKSFLKLTSTHKTVFISVSSVLFYAAWYPPAIGLLFYHTFLGWYGGKILERSKKKGARRKMAAHNSANLSRYLLFAVILLSLLPLLFFKYFDFFASFFNLHSVLVLPLGISFYTFSMIGYYVDIYRGSVKPFLRFFDMLLFVSFWPHLATGPILRAGNILGSISHQVNLSSVTVATALLLIVTGAMKKLLIADNIGAYVNWNLSYNIAKMSFLEAWATMLGFSAQIYADFSGYSDMAIGFALLLGFKLPANFNYPYRATSLTDFWRRWHISLSTWFRDYLYFPLGGSRQRKIRMYAAIIFVFVISGIWHGVGLGFFLWGLVHGICIVIEKIFSSSYVKLHGAVRWGITMTVIVFSWTFFRLEVPDALSMIKNLLSVDEVVALEMTTPYFVAPLFLMLLFLLLDHLFQFYKVDQKGSVVANRSSYSLLVLALLVSFAFTFSGEALPFIYFEF